jgi:Transposase DDE domain
LGLRLHLLCAPSGLPVAFALTGAKADERQTLLGMFAADPALLASRPRQTLIADKNYYGKQFETELADAGIALLRPARKVRNPVRDNGSSNHSDRSSSRSTTRSRHWISNVTADAPSLGVAARILQRVLALTAAI